MDIDLNAINDGNRVRIEFQILESILSKVVEYKFGKISFIVME